MIVDTFHLYLTVMVTRQLSLDNILFYNDFTLSCHQDFPKTLIFPGNNRDLHLNLISHNHIIYKLAEIQFQCKCKF